MRKTSQLIELIIKEIIEGDEIFALKFFLALETNASLRIMRELDNARTITEYSSQLSKLDMSVERKKTMLKHISKFPGKKVLQKCYIEGNTINDIAVVPYVSKYFPRLLREITDCPRLLYVKGNTDLLSSRNKLSMVGTRKLNTETKYDVQYLIYNFKHSNVVTVSGLASGVDSLVHKFSIEVGLPTIAVLPGDLRNIIPGSNYNLAEDIIRNNGLLVSEHKSLEDFAKGKYLFPRRNRIIAGLSAVTIIFQAAKKSGALITANQAFSYNRTVMTMSPENRKSDYEGNINLVAENKAVPVGYEIRNLLNFLGDQENSPTGISGKLFLQEKFSLQHLSPTQRQIYDLIEGGVDTAEKIMSNLQIDPAVINFELAKMQLSRLINVSDSYRISLNLLIDTT